MIEVIYNNALRKEYEDLFNTCSIHSERLSMCNTIAGHIRDQQDRYATIASNANSKMPWYVVGILHYMECGLRFSCHLHNGDPLTARTKHVPSGRPISGQPPFTFEESAADALKLIHFDLWKDWDAAGILFALERYNGLGYRQYHPQVKTPYLWSFTNHYSKGKYKADSKFDPSLVSQQMGGAALLKLLMVNQTNHTTSDGTSKPITNHQTNG